MITLKTQIYRYFFSIIHSLVSTLEHLKPCHGKEIPGQEQEPISLAGVNKERIGGGITPTFPPPPPNKNKLVRPLSNVSQFCVERLRMELTGHILITRKSS